MKKSLERLALAGLLALAGCSAVPGFVANSLGLPFREKVVMSKLENNELLAMDDTTCMVSRGRYEDVDIGESVACLWSAHPRRDVP